MTPGHSSLHWLHQPPSPQPLIERCGTSRPGTQVLGLLLSLAPGPLYDLGAGAVCLGLSTPNL